jgi:hypothetical protein
MSIPDLLRAFDANLTRAEAVAAGLTRAQFNRHPGPGRWSIAQCLAHLNVVNGQDLDPIAEAIRTARANGVTGAPPFRYGPLSSWFVRSMEPPVRSRMKAPKNYQPPPEADRDATVAEYRRISGGLRQLLESAEGLDLQRAKTTLPALPPLLRAIVRMPLGARFELIAAHDRRHLWQAEQARSEVGFPR